MGKCIESNFEGGSIEYISDSEEKIELSLEYLLFRNMKRSLKKHIYRAKT